MGRQTGCRKVTPHALGVGRRSEAETRRKFKRADHAERDRLAMQEAIREARGRLESMPECMAEIEQRPLASLAFVTRDCQRLGAAAHRDRVLARGAAREQLLPVRLQPSKKGGI